MRLAYIVPRYGPDVLGGAETLAREVIQQLAQRGHTIEVWTTCARNGWTNEYPAGVEQLEGITLHRFPVQPGRPFDLRAEPLTPERQWAWVNHQAHSPQLYDHIKAYGAAFDFLIFIPYLVGMTLWGARIHPYKSLIWPCLHDELFAYLAPVRSLLRQAAGLIFNSSAEHELMVKKLRIEHPRTVVVGMGLEVSAGDPIAFRQKYPHVAEQFLVYAGRLEPAKNVELLLRYFKQYQTQHGHKLDLVLLGDGPLNNGQKYPGVIPLGFVDEATKRNALAAASFLCQPSLNESFSIVLLEAWAQGRPVLVHEQCPVTLTHVRQAQGGLYFANYNDFAGTIEYLLLHPDQAKMMGDNGRAYVCQHYNWPVIMNRLEQTLANWLSFE